MSYISCCNYFWCNCYYLGNFTFWTAFLYSPAILSTLQGWECLGPPNNQSPLLSLCLSSSPSTTISSLLSSLLHHHLSISNEFFLFFWIWAVFLPSSFLALLPLPFFYMSQPSYPLSFNEFYHTLSIYGSVQFFIISKSPYIPLLDRPMDLSHHFSFKNS